jgi:hypothetical protein
MANCNDDGGILIQPESIPLTPDERAQLAAATRQRLLAITADGIQQLAAQPHRSAQAFATGAPVPRLTDASDSAAQRIFQLPDESNNNRLLLLADPDSLRDAQHSAQWMSGLGLSLSNTAQLLAALVLLALLALVLLVFIRWRLRRRLLAAV